MKATGIVRRIDDLGRVVIPKEIRRTLRIREGDPLEIFTDKEGEVILKKYSPIGEMNDLAKEYTDTLSQTLGHIACVADKDSIIAVSGTVKKEFQDKRISPDLEQIIADKNIVVVNKNQNGKMYSITTDDDETKYTSQIIAPIVSDGKGKGAVILLSKEAGTVMADVEVKVAQTAAEVLAKQMGE